jgi:ParB family chromosome partitioning protein
MAKATKKQALGRGLSALLKEPYYSVNSAKDKNADKVVGSIIDINLKQIEVNPYQPRTHFGEEELQELATSIKELGVIQPITVRKIGPNKFQLASGERRFRASKLIGNESIPAYIRIANDREMLEMALVENIQRKDLDAIEVALSYQRMIDELDLTQDQMSDRVGKKRSTITNYLRLLKLDPILQTGIRDGFLSMGHGRAIINVEDKREQLEIYEQIIKNGLSVRQTEKLVQQVKNGKGSKALESKPRVSEKMESGVKEMSNYLDAKISVTISSSGGGKLSIPFNSEQDFQRIKNLLK